MLKKKVSGCFLSMSAHKLVKKYSSILSCRCFCFRESCSWYQLNRVYFVYISSTWRPHSQVENVFEEIRNKISFEGFIPKQLSYIFLSAIQMHLERKDVWCWEAFQDSYDRSWGVLHFQWWENTIVDNRAWYISVFHNVHRGFNVKIKQFISCLRDFLNLLWRIQECTQLSFEYWTVWIHERASEWHQCQGQSQRLKICLICAWQCFRNEATDWINSSFCN